MNADLPTHEVRTHNLFLPARSLAGDPAGSKPIERATQVDESVRLVIRSRGGAGDKAKTMVIVDWNIDDVTAAIEFLQFIAIKCGVR